MGVLGVGVVMAGEDRRETEIVLSTEEQFILVHDVFTEDLWGWESLFLLFSLDKSRSSNSQGFSVCNLWAVFGDVSKHRGILECAGSSLPGCCVPSVEKLNFSKLLLHNFNVPWPTRCTGRLVCRLSPQAQLAGDLGAWAHRGSPQDWEGSERTKRIMEGDEWRLTINLSNFNILPKGQPYEKSGFLVKRVQMVLAFRKNVYRNVKTSQKGRKF